jgi:hypothetical protein
MGRSSRARVPRKFRGGKYSESLGAVSPDPTRDESANMAPNPWPHGHGRAVRWGQTVRLAPFGQPVGGTAWTLKTAHRPARHVPAELGSERSSHQRDRGPAAGLVRVGASFRPVAACGREGSRRQPCPATMTTSMNGDGCGSHSDQGQGDGSWHGSPGILGRQAGQLIGVRLVMLAASLVEQCPAERTPSRSPWACAASAPPRMRHEHGRARPIRPWRDGPDRIRRTATAGEARSPANLLLHSRWDDR